jgi:hypothetical protein
MGKNLRYRGKFAVHVPGVEVQMDIGEEEI